jgi:hypothetical protein
MKTPAFSLVALLLASSLSAQVTLSGSLSGNYESLVSAFAVIENSISGGTIYVSITQDITTTETARLEGSLSRVVLRPVGQRTLTMTAANKPLIHLKNSKNVWIDGISLTGDSTLTLVCTAAGSSAAVVFLEGDASRDHISSCTIRGGTITNASQFYGVVAMYNALGSTGCDQDTISGNLIREAVSTALPYIGISMEGRSSTVVNNNCIIENNQIVNVFNAGGFSDGIFSYRYNKSTRFVGNHIYLTDPLVISTALAAPNIRGIEIVDGGSTTLAGGFVVQGNWLGGTGPYCSGAPMTVGNTAGAVSYFGIFISGGTELSTVDDNHIANMDLQFHDPSNPNWYFFEGIFPVGGNVEIGTGQGNWIGSDTSTQSIVLHCFKSNSGFVSSSGINDQGNTSITIANNHIGGIAMDIQNAGSSGTVSLSGINAYLGGGNIHDNYIGAPGIPNSLEANYVDQDMEIFGISLESGAYSVTSNRISGMSNAAGIISGILFSYGANSGNSLTSKHNYISDLQVPDGAGSGADVAGINLAANAAQAQMALNMEWDTIRNLRIGDGPVDEAYLFGFVSRYFSGDANSAFFCNGTLKNCLIENLENRATGLGTTCAGINHWVGYKGGFTISGNTVHNLRSSSEELAGIVCSPASPAMMTNSTQRVTITKNRISELVDERITEANVIGIEVSGRQPLVTSNRIFDLQIPFANSTYSLAQGIQAYDVFGNQIVRIQNNMIALNHSTHANARAAGIYTTTYDASSASIDQTNVEFNSIYIGGEGDGFTAAVLKDGTGKVSLLNNIFYNDCIGLGPHTAIANTSAEPATNWIANASDHNYLVSPDPAALNLWGSASQDFSSWQLASNSDLHSFTRVSGIATFPEDLFVDKTIANLDLRLDHLDEVLILQNAAIPVSGISQDFFDNFRDPSTPDVGAREFATIVGVKSAGLQDVSISLSPNPAIDFVEVSATGLLSGDYLLRMTDVQGKICFEGTLDAMEGFTKNIPLKQLPAGVYLLTVATLEGAVTKQVVKL